MNNKNKIAKGMLLDLNVIAKIEQLALYFNMTKSSFVNTLLKRMNIADFESDKINKVKKDGIRRLYTLDKDVVIKLNTFAEYYNTKTAPFFNQFISDLSEERFNDIINR